MPNFKIIWQGHPDITLLVKSEVTSIQSIKQSQYRSCCIFQMMDKLDSWTSICPAGLSCFIKKLGDSFENRPINMFTVSMMNVSKMFICHLDLFKDYSCLQFTFKSQTIFKYFVDNILITS